VSITEAALRHSYPVHSRPLGVDREGLDYIDMSSQDWRRPRREPVTKPAILLLIHRRYLMPKACGSQREIAGT
jgi:hypothetical protein